MWWKDKFHLLGIVVNWERHRDTNNCAYFGSEKDYVKVFGNNEGSDLEHLPARPQDIIIQSLQLLPLQLFMPTF